MCGICGFLQPGLNKEVQEKTIKAMNEQIKHRGPDDEGYYIDELIALGHRRLSIIDLSLGHQPQFNEDNSMVIIYNGEIYNYKELTQALQKKGHKFRTKSDTEMIIHLYEEYGPDCLKLMNGMFAFAIWDSNKKELFLARDRFGIKPLYFYKDHSFFAFSSEIKAMVKHPNFKKELNLQALDSFLNFRYIPAPQTMFKNLYKLKPGHFLLIDNKGKIIEKQYWDIPFPEDSSVIYKDEEDIIEEFLERFENSVKMRLMSEVPLGILLSGGLDSTAVVAGLSRNLSNRLKTFSVGFKDDKDYNEFDYARLAAKKFETEHYEIEIDYKDFIDGIESYLYHVEEPMGDPASVPLFFVSQLAAKHVKVVLSGEGSDEILAGYNIYRVFYSYEKNKKFRTIPSVVRNFMLSPLNRLFLKSDKLNRYLQAANHPLSKHHLFFTNDHSSGARFSVRDKQRLLSKHVLEEIKLHSNTELLRDLYLRAENFNVLNQALYAQIKYWLPDDLLLKADKMTMAHSLELRVPFLDHHFAEYVNALPDDLKVRRVNNHYVTKYILRRAYQDIIPKEILERPKKGFPVPLSKIFNEFLLTRLKDYIGSSNVKDANILNIPYVTSQIQLFANGGSNNSQLEKRLWSIYVLLEWMYYFN